MSTPDRALLTEAGVRFHLRVAIASTHYLGCLLAAILGGVVGVVIAALTLSVEALFGYDVPLLALVIYLPMVLPVLFGWLATRTVLSTDRSLVIEGHTARLLQGDRAVWSGPAAELGLEEGTPYWTLTHGEERSEVINPPAELAWLLAELQRNPVDAGSEEDVPAMLRRRAAARRSEGG